MPANENKKYKSERKYAPSARPEAPEVAPSRSMVPSGGGPVNRGLVRPQWMKKVEQARAERPVRGPVPEKAKNLTLWERFWSSLFDPFDVWRAKNPERPDRPTGSLEDILVPEAERAYVQRKREEFQRGSYGRPAAPTSSYSRPGSDRPSYVPHRESGASERPRYERPGGIPQSQPAQPTQEASLADQVTPAYLDQVFNFEKVFEHVRNARKDAAFDGSAGVGAIAPAGIDPWGKVLKTAEFFGVPPETYAGIEREKVWDSIFGPFLGAVIRGINNAKPADLPGKFVFGTSPSGAFGLIYTEDVK